MIMVLNNGKGKEMTDSYVYDGEWRANLKHGFGIERDYLGNSYQGNWVRGKKTGHTTITFIEEDDAVYEGDVINGNFNGFGTFKSRSLIYQGDFKENKRNGMGTLWSPDWKDTEYTGQWNDGTRNGKGQRWYSDGSVY